MLGRFFKRGGGDGGVAPSALADGRAETPDLAARAAFMAGHILIHTHIPKTAGSALAAGLVSLAGGVRSMDTRQRRGIALEAMSEAELGRLDLITGHFGFGAHERFDRTPLYFACVRDPVDRAVSAYRFAKEHEDHGDHAKVAGRSFAEAWAEQDKLDPGGTREVQSRMLLGLPKGAKIDPGALAAQVTDAYFLVIPQAEVTPTIHQLRAAFGATWQRTPPVNVSRSPKVTVSGDLAERIRAANPADCVLYDLVCDGFEDRRAAACRYIANHCLQPLEGGAEQGDRER